ncbi:MAG TPA: M48 family metallopeptidase [Gemmatimonadales bacterium]|nr:M48 family metallopeptidase [Gemmatimonadales bacterium]
MKTHALAPAALLTSLIVMGPLSAPSLAQTTRTAQPGFNLFTVQQDVDLGRQSALEVEKQLKMLNDPRTDAYLTRIINRLAAVAPGAQYPYRIKAVNDEEINAFALPGGPMYVNRGLIEAARNEAELAGVLAHEMSHVALRHGTHQASKAYLTRSGISVLGGLFGRQSGSASQVVNAIGGVGLNAVFLKFSRDDEYQADATGTQIMAKAGYNPNAMATFFEQLRARQNQDPGKVATFFSDHPSSADREARIRQLANTLGPVQTRVVGGFEVVQARVRGLTASGQSTALAGRLDVPTDQPDNPWGRLTVSVQPPSTRFLRFVQPSGFFTVDYPDNWRTYSSGYAVTMAPQGGMLGAPDGRQVIAYGVIINHYSPFAGDWTRRNLSLQHHYAPFEDTTRTRGTLEDATDDLVRQIMTTNTYLRAEDGSARPETIDGAPGFSVLLSGVSPVTGEEERATLFTRSLPDGHVIYALAIVPAKSFDELDRTFVRMMRTLVVNDDAIHRGRNRPLVGPEE